MVGHLEIVARCLGMTPMSSQGHLEKIKSVLKLFAQMQDARKTLREPCESCSNPEVTAGIAEKTGRRQLAWGLYVICD